MSIASPAALADALRQLKLLDEKELQQLPALEARFTEAKALARELLERNWITAFQANQLLLGKGQSLILGSYVLLERLGAGGMGEVFKARHRNLRRIAAVKLIHKKRLDNPDAVRRFQREVRAAAALDHPNIVLAYDADQIGDTHLFVMEYIEGGRDLQKQVKDRGPLPVNQACEYVRQAALGLQHAHERGMVHRDIKPANILLMSSGLVVKILDMGLARLDSGSDDDKSGTMTQEGTVMGTPDYIAPEQAMDSHTVDIRADLYSLGCTLYFLLTGHVPYPGGNFMEKLLKHRLDEPKPLQQWRADVPPAVVAIVQKLMKKNPEDRYQTPAEVAAALGAVGTGETSYQPALPAGRATVGDETIELPSEGTAGGIKKAFDSALKYMGRRSDTDAGASPYAQARKAKERGMMYLALTAGVIAIVGIGFLTLLVTRLNRDTGNVGGDNNKPVVASNRTIPPEPAPAVGLLDGKWYYIGPFDNPKDLAGFGTVYPPEKEIDLQKEYTGKNNEKIRWKVYPKFRAGVVMDILPLFEKAEQKDWVCIYLYHEINVVEATSLPISFGNDDTLTVWLNNECLVSDNRWRNFTPETNNITLKLKAGKNKLLIKLCHGFDAWGISIAARVPLFCELASFEEWRKRVAALPAEKQVKEVAAKLKELNPKFDGKVEHKIEEGVVRSVEFSPTSVRDISPLRALSSLTGFRCVCGGSSLLTDFSPVKGMRLTWLDIGGTAISDLSPLSDMKLTYLGIGSTQVFDLSPLKNMDLVHLQCWSTLVSDLSPLENMNLTRLECYNTNVSDLSPLKNMKLTSLDVGKTRISDLSPLKNMELHEFFCYSTHVSDISPLREMKLTRFSCDGSDISDYTLLKGMPLRAFNFDFRPYRDTELLRSITTLESINNKPAAEFWQEQDAKQAAFDQWCKQVAAMPAEKQVAEVAAKLSELNPDFDGKVEHKIEEGVVKELKLCARNVKDISPVRAIAGLRRLECYGDNGKSQLSDLSPLKGMKLTHLGLGDTRVSDLSPIIAMQLEYLDCGKTRVSDLSSIKNMNLIVISIWGTPIKDLSPLKEMHLRQIYCGHTQISDLSPLKNMMLDQLHCNDTNITDLSVLKGMPLKVLNCDFNPYRDTEIVRSIKTLESVKNKPATEFWQEQDAKQAAFDQWCKQVAAHPAEKQVAEVAAKLKELNPGFDGQIEHQIDGGVVTQLSFDPANIKNIAPVRALPGLKSLTCCGFAATNRAPLSDLWPLKDMMLTELDCGYTHVTDLTPLKGMPLKKIRCPFDRQRNGDVLRSIKTLEIINDKPATEFWKDVEEKERAGKP